jgi:MFS transporter, PAT family, beta-lactamase induction signal transducer AmpG
VQKNNAAKRISPWAWVPSLYFAQGIPYVVVMTLSVVMYKNMGLSNTEIAYYTSWLNLPWVIKPLWSPLVEIFSTRRRWIWAMQFFVGTALALVAFSIPTTHFFQLTLAIFWLMAFSSATHDIAADGFYMLGLAQHQQAAFVGIRSTFYRVAMIAGQGGLVYLAGQLIAANASPKQAWQAVIGGLALVFFILGAHHFFALPKPESDQIFPAEKRGSARGVWSTFLATFIQFFQRPNIGWILAFLLLYRFGEAQALKLVTPFLLDPRSQGGLGLSTSDVGLVYGTIGVIALTCGGLLGGLAISQRGLKQWIWPMMLACHIPNLIFVLLSLYQPTDRYLIAAAIAIEQFGYGFGFAAYLLFMIMVADGANKTAHYAICTGFMAAGMMLPGMASGWIQSQLGYTQFFVWVCLACVPSLLIATRLKIDPEFGKKQAA